MSIEDPTATRVASVLGQLALHPSELNLERLRMAFVVYGGMSRTDWSTVSLDRIVVKPIDLAEQLLPLLRRVAL